MVEFNKHSKNPYTAVVWHSVDPQGNAVYHTNVVMGIFQDHIVLCTESIRDENERKRVIQEITSPEKNLKPRALIDISYAEMLNMCGNMIMVRSTKGDNCVIMSERARKGLTPEHLEEISKHYTIIASDLHMIETIGGGSARCMVAELY